MYLVDGERWLVKQQRRLRILLAIHGNTVSLILIVSFASVIVLSVVVATVLFSVISVTAFPFGKKVKYILIIPLKCFTSGLQ